MNQNDEKEVVCSSEEEINGVPLVSVTKRKATQEEIEEQQKISELYLGQPLKVAVEAEKTGAKFFSLLLLLVLIATIVMGFMGVKFLYAILGASILSRIFRYFDFKAGGDYEEVEDNEKKLKLFVDFTTEIIMCVIMYGIGFGIHYIYSMIF